MTEQDSASWAETRRRFSERFDGQTPAFDDDEDAAVAFRKHPAAIVSVLDELAEAFAAGKIHSPWRVFAKRLPRIERDNQVVSLGRDALVHRSELWILNAGVHFDREEEVLDALFDYNGPLKAWADDELLRARLIALWRAERPRGVQCEADRIERAERFKRTRT